VREVIFRCVSILSLIPHFIGALTAFGGRQVPDLLGVRRNGTYIF
jgi:hypothetical protein